jgi:TRAP-type C4-dicarboxylate transport system substrate-binding protein
MMTPDVIIISEYKWGSLTAEEQKILKEAAAESLEEQIKIWDATDDMNKEKGMKEGVTFVEVDKAPFRAAVKPMIDEAKKDPKLAPFIEKIEAL